MKLVLMGLFPFPVVSSLIMTRRNEEQAHLEVAQLGKLLPAVIELADVRFELLVDDPMCPHIASLREPLAADLTFVRSFARMAAFMRLFHPSKRSDGEEGQGSGQTLRLPS